MALYIHRIPQNTTKENYWWKHQVAPSTCRDLLEHFLLAHKYQSPNLQVAWLEDHYPGRAPAGEAKSLRPTDRLTQTQFLDRMLTPCYARFGQIVSKINYGDPLQAFALTYLNRNPLSAVNKRALILFKSGYIQMWICPVQFTQRLLEFFIPNDSIVSKTVGQGLRSDCDKLQLLKSQTCCHQHFPLNQCTHQPYALIISIISNMRLMQSPSRLPAHIESGKEGNFVWKTRRDCTDQTHMRPIQQIQHSNKASMTSQNEIWAGCQRYMYATILM